MANKRCLCGIYIKEGEELIRYFDGSERVLRRELCDQCYTKIGVCDID